jgi:Ubiquitin elongating factor core/U-box domain
MEMDLAGVGLEELERIVAGGDYDSAILGHLGECSLREGVQSMLALYGKARGSGKHRRFVGAVMDYILTILNSPEVFFIGERSESSVAHAVKHFVHSKDTGFLEDLAQEREEVFEEVAIKMVYAMPKMHEEREWMDKVKRAVGGIERRRRLKGAVDALGLLRTILRIDKMQKLLLSPVYWGIDPVDDALRERKKFLGDREMYVDREEMGKGMQEIVAHVMRRPQGEMHLKGFFDEFLEGFIGVGTELMADVAGKSSIEKYRIFSEFRESTGVLCRELHQILKELIVKDKGLMENFCTYVFEVFNRNRDRMKTEYSHRKVASDAFVHNLSQILLHFSTPFIKDMSKLPLIPCEFIERGYVDLSSLETISEKIRYERAGTEYKFVCKIFYGRVLLNLISVVSLIESLIADRKECSYLRRGVESAEVTGSRTEREEERRKHMVLLREVIQAKEEILGNGSSVENELDFALFEMEYITAAIKSKQIGIVPSSFVSGIMVKVSELFDTKVMREKKYTEDELSDLVRKLLLFTGRVVGNAQMNVHIKEKALMIMVRFSGNNPPFIKGLLNTLIAQYSTVQGQIKKSIPRLFYRRLIGSVLSNCLEKSEYAISIKEMELQEESRSFLVFLVSSLGDGLECGFEEIKKIKHAEERLEGLRSGKKEEGEEMRGVHSGMLDSRAMAKDFMSVAKEDLRLISTLFGLNKQLFLDEMIAPRFVGMLNGTMASLTGRKCAGLQIKNMAECMFRPKELLAEIVRLYLGMTSDKFVRCILYDEGLVSLDVFGKARQICERKGSLTPSELNRFKMFIERLQTLPRTRAETLDIPDEFMDPITYAPMQDPVILMTSSTRVDRSTAEMILLNDPTDPFTTTPLTRDDVVEDPGLKERIRKYFATVSK